MVDIHTGLFIEGKLLEFRCSITGCNELCDFACIYSRFFPRIVEKLRGLFENLRLRGDKGPLLLTSIVTERPCAPSEWEVYLGDVAIDSDFTFYARCRVLRSEQNDIVLDIDPEANWRRITLRKPYYSDYNVEEIEEPPPNAVKPRSLIVIHAPRMDVQAQGGEEWIDIRARCRGFEVYLSLLHPMRTLSLSCYPLSDGISFIAPLPHPILIRRLITV